MSRVASFMSYASVRVRVAAVAAAGLQRLFLLPKPGCSYSPAGPGLPHQCHPGYCVGIAVVLWPPLPLAQLLPGSFF